MNSEDGAKGINRPASILSKLLGEGETGEDVLSFDSLEEFEAARLKIINGE